MLTKHRQLVAQYLSKNFDLFFQRYNTILVQSDSYVTKRQSIKLLGELLLDRANYSTMTEYVDRGEHLKLCMNLLKDDRKMVQYEGFHVFKVGFHQDLCSNPTQVIIHIRSLSPTPTNLPPYDVSSSTIEKGSSVFYQNFLKIELMMINSRMRRAF